MSTVTGTVVVAHPDGGSVLLLAGDAVPEWAEAGLKGHPLVDADDSGDGWEGKSLADLNAEIDARNAQRTEELQIAPAGKKKADLVAALVADDAAAESA